EADAQSLYEERYCARGEMENRIKEQQLGLFADRTSSATLQANQLRLYFSSFAYVLLHGLRRLGLTGTAFAKAQSTTIRLKLLKNRCPPAPDSAQGLAVLLGSVSLRQ
ncbi:transposase, partial [Thiolapillus sp.]